MKAAVHHKYGPPEVVRIEEVPKPAPKDDEILIKVLASSVNSGDARLRALNAPPGFGILVRLVFGFFGPRKGILGMEVAGIIEAIGKDVSRFKVGDQVFAGCGIWMGGHAEYKVLSQDGSIAPKPPGLSFEEAATISFGGTTAMSFLKDMGKLEPGEKVLVNGASGATGTAFVQLARHWGAEVTGVCSSANLEMVKALGAHHVIDYTKEDFAKNGETYDIIVDCVGTAPWSRAKNSLGAKGRLFLLLAGLPEMLHAMLISRKNGKKVFAGNAHVNAEALGYLAKLIEQGHYKSVVDRTYPLEDIAKAHAYVDTGRKKGCVAIRIADAG